MAGLSRLSLALETGEVTFGSEGRIAVLNPSVGDDLSALPIDRCQVVTGFRPAYDHFVQLGFDCVTQSDGCFAAAIVFIARARAQSEALIARAVQITDGLVVVDGAKTDGIETIWKACRKKTAVSSALSKAHGKLFHFQSVPGFENWLQSEMHSIEDGFFTSPGLFSADGIDPASRLLADHLPPDLGARVADLGAGWGYLSARALEQSTVRELHLVEAEHAALECARRNISDARAYFHWADATHWQPEPKMDCVITNPPFHIGRTPDPKLGRAFIAAAARALAPKGQLFLVANRHLPYEAEIARHFAEVKEIAGDKRFKLLHAARTTR